MPKLWDASRSEDIDRIFETFTAFETVEKYAYRAMAAEVRENECNLNIPRYVDTFEPELVCDKLTDRNRAPRDHPRRRGEIGETGLL